MSSLTVQSVYDEVCTYMLEDNGLVYFSTPTDFIDLVQSALQEILQETGLVKAIVTVGVTTPGVDVYNRPDSISDIQGVMVDEVYLEDTNMTAMDLSNRWWPGEQGPAEQWTEQELTNQFRIKPVPDYVGTIKIIGTAQPTLLSTWVMGTTIPLIPNSFVLFFKFKVLEKIFSTDGESKDMGRAKYCKARWTEGTNLGAAIMSEQMLEEQ